MCVCVCVCLSVRTTFTPIDKPFEDRFRCGKVHKLQCNKFIIHHTIHSLVPHSVPASLSWLPICPFSTTLKYDLFTDNYANWRQTGERKGVQTYMYLGKTSRVVVWSQDNPGQSFAPGLSWLEHVLQLPFGHVVVWGSAFFFFTSRTRLHNFGICDLSSCRQRLRYSSRLSLSTHHRGCSRQIVRPGEGVLEECLRFFTTFRGWF